MYRDTKQHSIYVINSKVASPEECCAKCTSEPRCILWVFSPKTKSCWIKDNMRDGHIESDRITGTCGSAPLPPAPAPAPAPSSTLLDVKVNTNVSLTSTGIGYVSYTLDWWSPNEGCRPEGWGPNANVLEVDFLNPKLIALTKALGPAYLRIGCDHKTNCMMWFEYQG